MNKEKPTILTIGACVGGRDTKHPLYDYGDYIVVKSPWAYRENGVEYVKFRRHTERNKIVLGYLREMARYYRDSIQFSPGNAVYLHNII